MKSRYANLALLVALLLICVCAVEPLSCAAESSIEVSEEVSASQNDGNQASMSTDVYIYVNPHTASDVTFKVTDEDGNPIAGARIYLSLGGHEELYGSTDENGELTCHLLRGVQYGYRVVRSGYISATGAFTTTTATRVVNITLQTITRVEFVVVDGARPVPGVHITIGGVAATTDAEGSAVFNLPDGIYEAALALPDGAVLRVKFSVKGDTLVVIDVGEPPPDEEAARLHREYLGAGGGLGDLFILFDKDYVPDNYLFWVETYTDDELLAALPDDLSDEERARALAILREALPNIARVVAQPDMIKLDNGEFEIVTDEFGNPIYSHRNLLMSLNQIARLQEMQIDMLALENALIGVSLSLNELREDRIAKLLTLMYKHGAALLNNLPDAQALDALPEVTTWLSELPPGEAPQLTYNMFSNAMLEIRLTPIRDIAVESVAHAATAHEIRLTSDEIKRQAAREHMDLGFLTATEQLEIGALKAVSPVYRAQVYISVNGVEVNITSLLKTLDVSISAEALLSAEREMLLDEGAPEEDIRALARESLMRRVTLATIASYGDIEAEGYLPGDYTSLLDTALRSEASLDEAALRALTETLQELYDVKIIDGQLVLASRTLTVPRALVIYYGDIPRDAELEYRLAARAAISGLYLVAELPQPE